MRNNHINLRNYELPFDLLEFSETIKLGVPVQEFKIKVSNIKGSVIEKENKNNVNPMREFTNTKSIVLPNPPFEINPETMKLRFYNKIWKIIQINKDWLTRGEIQLTVIYENESENENG